MKILFGLVLTLTSISTFASNSIHFYTIKTNDVQSEYELASACTKSLNLAEPKLSEISLRLSGNVNALTVAGFYGWTSNTPNFPTHPEPDNEFYCVLKFTSLDPSIHFNALSTANFDHLLSSNWDTACSPAYDAALANPNSPITLYWKSWTLTQGRMCEVTTVTATKSN